MSGGVMTGRWWFFLRRSGKVRECGGLCTGILNATPSTLEVLQPTGQQKPRPSVLIPPIATIPLHDSCRKTEGILYLSNQPT